MTRKTRLCFIGNMLGRNPGCITTQGQIVADLFADAGYPVISASPKINRAARLADIARTIVANRRQIDVLVLEVYSGLSMVTADVAAALAKTLRLPLIAVLHGGNLPAFSARYPQWTNRVLRRADVLVAPSTFLAEQMSRFDLPIRVVPNVIALDDYAFRLRRRIAPRLLWMRSFHPVYNPEMALKVLAALREIEPAATLTMAGVDKGLEAAIKKQAQEMRLADVVSFPGFLDQSKKVAEFARADVYLNTNRIDNMPVSVVEARACGLPVVATDVGGLRHLIVNNENGLLIPDDDAAAMTAAVKRLLDDPLLTEKISLNGRRFAERSDWSSVRSQWEALFAEISRN